MPRTAPRLRRLAPVAVVLLAFAAAACGDDGGERTAPTRPSTTIAARTQVLVALVRGEQVGMGGRKVSPADPRRGAMEALLRGPDPVEAEAGLATQIPDGTRLLGLDVADGTARVDLSGEFASGGGSLSMQLRVAQVVFTLTQFPDVDRVAFALDGTDAQTIGGEGLIVDPPVDRADFESVTPQVLTESPFPGERVASPVRFAGSANTFEANVRYRVERPDGTELTAGFTTATSGSGTRGTFETEVDLGDFLGPAVFVSFADNPGSPEGGPPEQSVSRIPIEVVEPTTGS